LAEKLLNLLSHATESAVIRMKLEIAEFLITGKDPNTAHLIVTAHLTVIAHLTATGIGSETTELPAIGVSLGTAQFTATGVDSEAAKSLFNPRQNNRIPSVAVGQHPDQRPGNTIQQHSDATTNGDSGST
jgi:hypothetical protein